MKKFSAFLAIACTVSMLSAYAQDAAAPAAPAEQPAVETEETKGEWVPDLALTLEWDSKYVSKGKVLTPDPVASTDFWVGLKGFYIEMWNQFDMSAYNRPHHQEKNPDYEGYINNRKGRMEEIDYFIGYSYTFDKDTIGGLSPLSLGLDWEYYQYPRLRYSGRHYHDNPLRAKVSLDNFLDPESAHSLGIGSEFYYDLDHYQWYGDVFAKYGYAINDKLSAGVKNTWYWADSKYNQGNNGYVNNRTLNSTEIKLSLDYAVCKNVSVGGYVAGAWAIDKEVRDYWYDNSNNNRQNFWGGVTCSFAY